jgi:hypothetical protein
MAPKPGDVSRQTLKPSKASKPLANSSRSSTSKRKPPAKQFKSAEFIVDSDDEAGDEEITQKQKEPKAKPVSETKTAVAGSKKAGKEVKKTAKDIAKSPKTPPRQDPSRPKVNGVKPKEAPKPSDSSESESEEATPANPASTAKEDSQSSTSEESSSSEDEDEKEKSRPKSGTTAGKEKTAEVSADSGKSGSEVQTEGDSDDSDSSGEKSDASDDDATSPSPGDTQKKTRTSELRPAQPFEPPEGFEEVDDASCSAEVRELLQRSALAGKQIWYITAPTNVPISLDKIDLNQATKREPIIRHEGRDYCLEKGTASSRTQTSIMLPDEGGYKAISSKIIQVVHLQQVVRLPHMPATPSLSQSQGSQNSHDSDDEPQKPKREQPKGLRMRNRPSGFGNEKIGSIGSDSSEDEDILYARTDSPPTFHQPPGLSSTAESLNPKKRKEREDRSSEQPSPKKSKKDDRMGNGNVASSTTQKKKRKHKHGEVIPDSFDTLTPLTMTVLQTSNTNGITTAASEATGTDGSVKERKKKKKLADKARDDDSSLKTASSTQGSITQPAAGVEGQSVKKKKKKEKSSSTKEGSQSSPIRESKSAVLAVNGVFTEKKSLLGDSKQEKEKKKKKKHRERPDT